MRRLLFSKNDNILLVYQHAALTASQTSTMRSAASNADPFYFIEGNVVASPIVKLSGSRGLVIGDMLSHFELAGVL